MAIWELLKFIGEWIKAMAVIYAIVIYFYLVYVIEPMISDIAQDIELIKNALNF